MCVRACVVPCCACNGRTRNARVSAKPSFLSVFFFPFFFIFFPYLFLSFSLPHSRLSRFFLVSFVPFLPLFLFAPLLHENARVRVCVVQL